MWPELRVAVPGWRQPKGGSGRLPGVFALCASSAVVWAGILGVVGRVRSRPGVAVRAGDLALALTSTATRVDREQV
jgi:hypothetical protein